MVRGCLFTFALVLVAFVAYCGSSWISYENRERVLAMEWGDGSLGKGYYGAKVTLERESGGYAVHGIVLIGPDGLDDNMYRVHECGIIGHVANVSQATQRFGTVVWKKDGLHIGPYFVRQETIEHDR